MWNPRRARRNSCVLRTPTVPPEHEGNAPSLTSGSAAPTAPPGVPTALLGTQRQKPGNLENSKPGHIVRVLSGKTKES